MRSQTRLSLAAEPGHLDYLFRAGPVLARRSFACFKLGAKVFSRHQQLIVSLHPLSWFVKRHP